MASNRLKKESSPYLLQHANNPVDWYPWGEEALNTARERDLPIILSIGYSACHWCHVMEHESFEDAEVARYMNEHFINIKVDREERPDLDHIYMEAVQAISGSGGWPLNVFLTPETKPFYGGTYFPPKKMGQRASWSDTLAFITEIWRNKRKEIMDQADVLIRHIGSSGNQLLASKPFSLDDTSNQDELFAAHRITENIMAKADIVYGGFGSAPKFPQTFTLQFLMHYGHVFKKEKALTHATFSLKQMFNGGIYDQIAGGLARYSTDAAWLAPHFEKMLYDNALLLITTCDAYQITKDVFFKDKIKQTIAFLQRSMRDTEGGFYAALDADSEGVEGKYYVWDKGEIQNTVEESALYAKWYGVTDDGNWEEKNILHVSQGPDEFARQNNISVATLESIVQKGDAALLAVRDKRIPPATDDKILLGWNALLVTALCKAYAAIGEAEYKDLAVSLFAFIEKAFRKGAGSYAHTYKKGVATYPAFLDDYAYLIQACIHLQEVCAEEKYLVEAHDICTYVMENFVDSNSNLFHFTEKNQKDIILRKTEIYDGAVPSGNSVMAENLYYLGIIFNKEVWVRQAKESLAKVQEVMQQYPTSFGYWASVYLKQALGMHEVVITGRDIKETLKEILQIYLPNRIIHSSEQPADFPLLKGKDFSQQVLIHLCRQYTCALPVTTVDSFKKQLFKEYLNINVHNI